jgi:hypothetical protein
LEDDKILEAQSTDHATGLKNNLAAAENVKAEVHPPMATT